MKKISFVSKMLAGSALAIGVVAPLHAQASASAFTWATRYDYERRVVGTLAPDPDGSGPIGYAAVRNSYDADGRLVRVETGELSAWQSESVAPKDWTGFTIFKTLETSYDASGRKLKDVVRAGDANGAIQTVTQYANDGMDRVVCSTVRMNSAAFTSLPSDACTLGTEGTQGPDRITKTGYGTDGRVYWIKKAYGTPLQQDYVHYSYTPNGKLKTVTDANGSMATMHYDTLDRQDRWYFPSKTTAGESSTTDYEEYGYDLAGRRTSLKKRDGQLIGYTYDALGRMTVKDLPGGSTLDVYYSYDNRGLQLSARFGSISGQGVTNAYDNMGRLSSSTVDLDGVSRTLTRQYDADGNRTAVIHPDTTLFGYSYDGLDRPVNLSLAGTSVFAQYVYNAQGGTSALNRGTAANTSYGYDGISRLSSLTQNLTGTSGDVAFAFSYNAASQVVSRSRSNDAYMFPNVDVARSYTVNGLNQYQTAGPATFTYDANGNLTSDGSVSLTYDVENRLISASGEKSATLRYDPLGRLYETSGGSAGVTRFLYDGDELVAEYDGSGNMLRRYIHGNGADDPVAWVEGPTTWRYLHSDHQGSVVAISDDAGNLLSRNSYDEWGIPAATNVGRFQYTGQAWIPELGMYYYKARIYSPTLGRFLQTDPVGYDDQINLYAYVGNDPINQMDPSGLYDCDGKEACDAAEKAKNQIRWASVRLASSGDFGGARALSAANSLLGNADDGNGINIKSGDLSKKFAYGETTGSKGNIQITLDLKAHEGRHLSEIGNTLAHELTHSAYTILNRSESTPSQWMNHEAKARFVGDLVSKAYGIPTTTWMPGMSIQSRWRAARKSSYAACISATNERNPWAPVGCGSVVE